MMRATLILIAVVWTLSLAGCGGGDPEASESAAEAGPVGGQAGSTDGAIDSSGAKTEIVRALLATLDEVKGDGEGAKNDLRGILLADDDELAELRRSLVEADVELRRILGDNSKRLILAANKKPVVPIVGTPAPARAASDDRSPGARPKAGDPGPPQTPIVKTLIDAIDQSDDEDEGQKAALKRSLIEADVELRQVLGGNAKRMIIEHANKKPVVRRIPEGLPVVESP